MRERKLVDFKVEIGETAQVILPIWMGMVFLLWKKGIDES